jgi:hypothetical protein
MPPPTKTSPPIKTPTCSSTHSRRGTCSTAAPLTLSPIASTPDTAVATTTSASTGSVRVYSAITIFARINIVRKWVTNIVKDVRAIDRRFNKFKDSLSKIKDKLAFLRRGIITLIRNTGLLDIEYR